MAMMWNESAHSLIWKLTLEGFSFEVSEAADLANDVLFLTTLFLTRGNNLRKILTTIDKQVKEALQAKIKTYNLKSYTDEDASKRKRNEKVEMSSKELTLSRITASFPQIALAVVMNTDVRGKADLLCMGLQYKIDYGKSSDPPAILTHGLIPALLPKTSDSMFLELKKFSYFFNIEQTVTLQTPSMKRNIISEPISRSLELAEKFVNAAINGPLNSDTSRQVFLKHLGLEDPSEEIKRWIAVGAKLHSKAAAYGSYYMLQNALTNELMLVASRAGINP